MNIRVSKVYTVLLFLILLPQAGTAFELDVSEKEIRTEAAKGSPPLWRIPLGPGLVDEMHVISPGTILVGLKKYDRSLTNLDIFLLNTDKGEVLWRYPRKKYKGKYHFISAASGIVLFRIDSGQRKTTLLALYQ